ncbi:MAG: hypothetical protein GY793_09370 [Proteobacteria bacterium]|nr:hypothetical protein [Pseudomonadota bacterium]
MFYGKTRVAILWSYVLLTVYVVVALLVLDFSKPYCTIPLGMFIALSSFVFYCAMWRTGKPLPKDDVVYLKGSSIDCSEKGVLSIEGLVVGFELADRGRNLPPAIVRLMGGRHKICSSSDLEMGRRFSSDEVDVKVATSGSS